MAGPQRRGLDRPKRTRRHGTPVRHLRGVTFSRCWRRRLALIDLSLAGGPTGSRWTSRTSRTAARTTAAERSFAWSSSRKAVRLHSSASLTIRTTTVLIWNRKYSQQRLWYVWEQANGVRRPAQTRALTYARNGSSNRPSRLRRPIRATAHPTGPPIVCHATRAYLTPMNFLLII